MKTILFGLSGILGAFATEDLAVLGLLEFMVGLGLLLFGLSVPHTADANQVGTMPA